LSFTLSREKTDPDSVYIVTGSITVLSGVTLTIEPGVVVKFNSSQYMTVHGTLNAVGGSSPENTIYFTSIRDDNRGGDTNGDGSATAPSIGIWRSIYFSSGSDASQMEYCEVRWGGYYSTYYGVIDINGASPTIENCTITDNYYGISVRGTASPSLTGNTIRNSTYTPFLMTFWSTPVYSGNTWESNVYNAVGIIGGTLEADAFLQKRDVAGITNAPYLLMSSITIPSSYSLTLEAGIVLKMYNSSTRIDVEGALIADGTEEEKIAFTSVKDDQHGGDVNNDGNITSPSMSDWGCINFKDSSDDLLCILDHCIIAYAGNYSPHYGAVGLTFANTVITNCEFANNPHGIYMSGDSEPQIQNNHIRNCTKPPIIMSINSDPVFSGNTFENNDYTALGIIGETVSVSTTITRRNVAGFENITYLVWGTVTIDPGTEITIEPGVVIKFKDNGLIVNGDLIAIGSSPDSLIVFTSYRDDTCGNPIITIEDDNDPNYRDWYDVRFNSTSNPAVSIMEYCEVRYAGRYHSYPYYPARGGISAWSASPTISHCTISNNVYGIVCGGNSEPVITGNTITDSQYTPIFMSLSSNPDFSGNTFDNNGYKALGIMEGTLSQDAHLFQRTVAGVKNLAYLSLHSITIAPGATLTIDPGVVIKFYGTNLHVEGALIASGTVENNIIFTSYKDDSQGGDTNNDANESSPSNNDWYEIVFKDTSIDETCILDNCQIKFAYGTYGAIRIQSASPTILNCLISDIHTHAIQIEGHSITVIDSCSIINCNDLPIVQSIKAEPAYSNISLYNNEYEALGILQETLSLDDTLHVRSFAGHDNITYVMDNTLTVNAGTALTIDPGIIIKFKTYYGYYSKYITVDGALIADGTTEDKIVFTSIKDDIYGGDTNLDLSSTVPGDNDWTKIAFTGSSSDSLSILDHCIFRYAYAGGLNISNASPPVSNCTFNNNRYGIILTGTSGREVLPVMTTLSMFSWKILPSAPVRYLPSSRVLL